jgi:xanthine permease XanP
VKTELVYGLDDKPPFRETIFVALQHVFAVFVGIVTPPLII